MTVEFLKGFRKWFGSEANTSAKEAKERLQIILVHDRTDISPQLLGNLRMEMINVLTKYMDIDETKIEMNLDHAERSVALVTSIPVLRIKRGASVAAAEDEERESTVRAEASRPQNPHKGRRRR